MEGLGESKGKAAIFASQKMSALCLGGVWCGGPSVGGGLGGSWMGALEAGAALQRELRGSVPGPWNGSGGLFVGIGAVLRGRDSAPRQPAGGGQG